LGLSSRIEHASVKRDELFSFKGQQMMTFLFTLLSTLVFAAVENPTVATINGRAIKMSEFQQRFDEASRLHNPPSNKKIFLEELIRYEVGVQEAEKRKISEEPVVKERIRQQLYVGLVEKDLGEKINGINVSPKEMEAYYKTSPEMRSRHILIEIKPGATDVERAAGRKRAEEILKEVKSSKKPFEELVKIYTDDLATKKNGGDVGFQNRFSTVPPYYEGMLKLKVGEVSGVVETKFGFHIIKLTEVHSYDEADKDLIRNAIFERKRLAMFNEYFDKLKKKYNITINTAIVK
jgi:peptidyl-prolyl cis-trans isomerase C/peptidyl-prolyl cis-trans isomerase D